MIIMIIIIIIIIIDRSITQHCSYIPTASVVSFVCWCNDV